MTDSYPTPSEIVAYLDQYVIGQSDAKKSVAIALRNRWRRQQVPGDMRGEIMPNNIILIGPTGVGKTEIARRLADLARAPFIKVEASKFTEVGYVGRDVESMIRDLADVAVNMVRDEKQKSLTAKAEELVIERLLDLLLGGLPESTSEQPPTGVTTREKFRKKLADGKLEDREVEVEAEDHQSPVVEIFSPSGMEELGVNFQEMFSGLMPRKTSRRKMPIGEARRYLLTDELNRLVSTEDVIHEALDRVQETGIVFIDEIDKVVGDNSRTGPDVSREGVQRDFLPIVEGCTVTTKYGMIRTDHILFVAAGAFHGSRPSDLIPELQGRFPIRVELDSLSAEEFERILTEPKASLVKQYQALMLTENLNFASAAVKRIAEYAEQINTETENIGARRLHTVLTTLLEDLLFEPPTGKKLTVTAKMVDKALDEIVADEDLSRYVL